MHRRQFLATAATALSGCAAAAGPTTPALDHSPTAWEAYDPAWRAPDDVPPTDVVAETVVSGLEIPWDVAFAPDGTAFLTERVGRVSRLDGETLAALLEPADAIDAAAVSPGPDDAGFWETWWLTGGEGGVLGVAVHPTYPDPAAVYVYYTAREERAGPVNRVVRFDANADDPAATATVVLDDVPADAVHDGGRVAFGPDDYLWVTTGDAGTPENAQDGRSLGGKVLRLRPDGRAAPDNPRVGGRDPRVYTLGHRNPQGLTWLPDGTPVVTEHGPAGRDEVNLLSAGANYGWPHAREPGTYAGTDYHRPVLSTGGPPSWAPTGGVFYTGNGLPGWRNRLVFGQLFGQRVGVCTLTSADETPPDGGVRFDADWLDDAYAATVHHALSSLGRVRCVAQGPDGHLYATTSNRDGRAKGAFPRPTDDRLVRLRPAASLD